MNIKNNKDGGYRAVVLDREIREFWVAPTLPRLTIVL